MKKMLWMAAALAGLWCGAMEVLEDDIATRVVLFPIQEATLAAPVESRVASIGFKEGESFEIDEVLLELDDLTFRQRVDRLSAAVNHSELDVQVAEEGMARAERLRNNAGGTLISEAEYDKAKLELSNSRSRLVAAQAELAVAERELADCRVRAPFSGRLIKWLINPHEYVRTGQPLVALLDDTKVLAAMHLASHIRPGLKIGDEVVIAVDDLPERSFTGGVYEIGGNIDAASRTFELKVLLDNPDGELIAGMAGRLVTRFAAPEARTP